jgi:membrane fusion protein, multidrug efflux system
MTLQFVISAGAQAFRLPGVIRGDRGSRAVNCFACAVAAFERSIMRFIPCNQTRHSRGSAVAVLLAVVGVALPNQSAAEETGPSRARPLMADVSTERSVRREQQAFPTDGGVASGEKVRVVVRAYELAAISAEINARITRLPEREGDRFSKGDVLVEFDCRRLVAELRASHAIVQARQAAYDTERQRLHYKSTGTLAFEQARSELEKASADADAVEARRTSCQIIAPFDGRVTEKAAQVHEIAQTNQPLMRIINERKLELMLMVPSSWLARIPSGTMFDVKLDETGQSHAARILQSTGLIDPVSQSARLIAEFVDPLAAAVSGMSGTATFTLGEETK